MFGIADARATETTTGELADVPGDDTSEMPGICEKRSRSSTDYLQPPPSKRIKQNESSPPPPPLKEVEAEQVLEVGEKEKKEEEEEETLAKNEQDLSSTNKSQLMMMMKNHNLKQLCICLEDISKNSNYKKLINEKKKSEYEVESIIDRKLKDNDTWYLIKWKNWSNENNTWEPKKNLINCLDIIDKYENEKHQLLEKFKKLENFNPTIINLQHHMSNLMRKKKLIDNENNDDIDLYKYLDLYFNSKTMRNNKVIKKIKYCIINTMYHSKRNDQLDSLNDWEIEINNITKGKPIITIENNIDLECAPADFYYIDDYLPGTGVIIPDEPPIGCDCDKCDSKGKCCYSQYEDTNYFPYTSGCRVRVPPGTPIYECNKRCKCPSDCKNRVVQRGSNVNLCIFRTPNERGWGVKTKKIIKKGTFITQYVGEVITNEEAEKRGKAYDAAGRTYLFDLDYNEAGDKCPYTVDAALYGNISHFINHSCEPNSAVYGVWINCLDPDLPNLALFATQDIHKDEEITFDYMRQSTKISDKNKFNSSITTDLNVSIDSRQRLELPDSDNDDEDRENKTRCKCGAKSCRQYLF